MLEKKYRMLATRDFERVFARGGLVPGPFFLIRYLKRGRPESRFGFVVSTKVSKKAVERNTLKRRLREIARGATPFLSTGYDYVFIMKKTANKTPFAVLKENAAQALQKVR